MSVVIWLAWIEGIPSPLIKMLVIQELWVDNFNQTLGGKVFPSQEKRTLLRNQVYVTELKEAEEVVTNIQLKRTW